MLEPSILQVFKKVNEGQAVIKAIREAANMSQQDFANRLKTTVTTISRWENGRASITLNIPQVKALVELLNELEIPISTLPDDWGPEEK